MERSNKRLAIITDPHIKVDDTFFVFSEGLDVKMTDGSEQNRGAFIRDSEGLRPFVGKCWPNESVWVDFLNDNAADFWSTLYSFKKFKGTNKLFSYWIDMNEPSVFSGDELTMPKNTIHLTASNKRF
jgi:alpha 1,3-glucosidase